MTSGAALEDHVVKKLETHQRYTYITYLKICMYISENKEIGFFRVRAIISCTSFGSSSIAGDAVVIMALSNSKTVIMTTTDRTAEVL